MTVFCKLRDIWILLSKDHSKPIDVLMWLSRATLDVVGIAGTWICMVNLQDLNIHQSVIQVLYTISTPSRAKATRSLMLTD